MFSTYLSKITKRARLFPFTWWLAVLVVAATAGFVVTTTVAKASAAAERYDGVTSIYVATHAVAAGTKLNNGDVELQNRPRAFIPAGAVVNNVVGTVATESMSTNDVITTTNTGASGLSPTAALLNVGEQGIAVGIDEKSPDYQIGDNVTVFATFETTETTAAPTIAVAQQARVIHISDHAVTVAVSDEDAPKVAFAVAKGTVTIAISTPGRS